MDLYAEALGAIERGQVEDLDGSVTPAGIMINRIRPASMETSLGTFSARRAQPDANRR
jgi:hypothetical protein